MRLQIAIDGEIPLFPIFVRYKVNNILHLAVMEVIQYSTRKLNRMRRIPVVLR